MKRALLLLAIAVSAGVLLSFAIINEPGSQQPGSIQQIQREPGHVEEWYEKNENTLSMGSAKICGKVRASHDNAVIQDAEVLVFEQDVLIGKTATTNDSGYFCVEIDQRHDRLRLTANAVGYESNGVLWQKNNLEDVQIRLSKNSGLQLLVKDLETGLPIDIVSIDVESSSDRIQSISHRAAEFPMDKVVTDSGLVSLPALPLKFWKFLIAARGYGTEAIILDLGDVDLSVPHAVNLRRKASLSGIVYDRNTGSPIAGASVGYKSSPEPDKFGRPFADVSTVTADDGSFSFDDIKLGVGRLFVRAEDYAPVDRVQDIVEGGFVQVGLGPDITIAGTVYRSDGVTATQGRITLTNIENGARTNLKSDSNGRFLLVGIRRGEYTVSADTLYGQTDQCEIAISPNGDSVECELVVNPGGTNLHVKLINIDFDELGGSVLELWVGEEMSRKIGLPSEYSFAVGGVKSGKSVVRILLANGGKFEQSIIIRDESDHYLTIDMNAR